jgi:hypothetical protein
MTASTPVARSKTAALTRISDSIHKGYCRWTAGRVKTTKAEALARKFHERYGIGCSPGQRITRKAKGVANALLVMYWPPEAEHVEWLLLATAGTGLEGEDMRDVTDKKHLNWLCYELVRHAIRGRTAWTWRRPKSAMAELHTILTEQLNRRHYSAVAATVERIARQPGFHGVREQNKVLFHSVRSKGFSGELPRLYYVEKVKHGEQLTLD